MHQERTEKMKEFLKKLEEKHIGRLELSKDQKSEEKIDISKAECAKYDVGNPETKAIIEENIENILVKNDEDKILSNELLKPQDKNKTLKSKVKPPVTRKSNHCKIQEQMIKRQKMRDEKKQLLEKIRLEKKAEMQVNFI